MTCGGGGFEHEHEEQCKSLKYIRCVFPKMKSVNVPHHASNDFKNVCSQFFKLIFEFEKLSKSLRYNTFVL